MNSFFDFVLALWVVDEEHWKVSGMNSERRYGFRLSAFAAALHTTTCNLIYSIDILTREIITYIS